MTQPPMQPNYMPPQSRPGNGLAIASLVLGIVSTVLFCVWYLSIPLGVLAIVFGAIGGAKAKRGEASGAGMAKTGLILGVVGPVLAVILIIAALAGLKMFGNRLQQIMQQQQQRQQQMQQSQTQPSTTEP